MYHVMCPKNIVSTEFQIYIKATHYYNVPRIYPQTKATISLCNTDPTTHSGYTNMQHR